MKCNFCDNEVSIYLDLSDIPFSVTSDSRIINKGITLYKCKNCFLIQKKSSIEEQKDYFEEFISHNLTEGQEQVKFINNVPYPRSELIIKALKKQLNDKGSLLDIGTGNGSFIKSFKKYYPNYDFFAQDIQNNSSNIICNLIKKENFFLCDLNKIKNQFDLISLIHVLGHIPDIKSFLCDLKKLLKQDSQIIIQTPDLERSFFDVTIIDQISHFTKYTLSNIISSETTTNIDIVDSIDKEITLITNTTKKVNYYNNKKEIDLIAKKFEKFIRYIYNSNEEFILLGTSPSSAYLGAILKNRLVYFIDEDESKINKSFLSKNIKEMPKKEIPQRIILPFLYDKIINDIKSRYTYLNFVSIKDIK